MFKRRDGMVGEARASGNRSRLDGVILWLKGRPFGPRPLPAAGELVDHRDTRVVYIGDPMCSWCWGFAPEIERVAEFLSDYPAVAFEVVVGGLRPGPDAQPLDGRLVDFLRPEWAKIQQATGQPFSFAALEWKDWIYDTEVPAAAVALSRDVGLGSVLGFMARIQRAFYAESVDVTRPEVYAELWTHEPETSVSADEFVDRLTKAPSRDLAYADFRRSRELGVRGFPAVVFERDGASPLRKMVAYGYQPADQMLPVLDRLLSLDEDSTMPA
jgi:putative protein-disulfide isomerase